MSDIRISLIGFRVGRVVEALRELGADVYDELTARAVEVTGRPLIELPDNELRLFLQTVLAELMVAREELAVHLPVL